MNTGLTTERKYVNKDQDWEVRYSKGRRYRTGYKRNRKFEDGGSVEVTSPEEYFASLNYSKLPSAFTEYLEKEVINDPELNTVSMNDPIFVELMDKINGYMHEEAVDMPIIDENQEAISALEELLEVQTGADREETLEAIEFIKELIG